MCVCVCVVVLLQVRSLRMTNRGRDLSRMDVSSAIIGRSRYADARRVVGARRPETRDNARLRELLSFAHVTIVGRRVERTDGVSVCVSSSFSISSLPSRPSFAVKKILLRRGTSVGRAERVSRRNVTRGHSFER